MQQLHSNYCSLVSFNVFSLIYDFIEIRIDIIPVLLQWQAVLKVRLNISKLCVVSIFYLYVGQATMMSNTLWYLLFKDFFGLFFIVLTFY